MKKHLFVTALSMVCFLTFSALVSCGGNSSESTHEHTFSNSVWEYDSSQHWHPSSCGHDVTSSPTGHTFEKKVTPATYSEGGYTTYTCSVCGYSYKDDETSRLEHGYSEEWSHDSSSHWHACTDEGCESLKSGEAAHDFESSVTAATYASEGYTTFTCKVCGYSYKGEETSKLEHHYSEEWSRDASSHWHACLDDGFSDLRSDESQHDFQTEATPATYSEGGYTTYTCSVCGYSYKGDETSKLEHKYTLFFDLNGGTSESYVASKGVESFSCADFFFDCEKNGCNFRGWSYNGTKVFDEEGNLLFTPVMAKQMTFLAVYENDAKVTIKTNMDEAGTVSGGGYYDYNADVDVLAVPNQGYVFVGWYDEKGILLSNQDSFKYRMDVRDIVIKAKFKLNHYTLTIESNDAEAGLVCTVSLAYAYQSSDERQITFGDEVKIAAYTKTGDIRFLGWFDEDNELVSTNPVYSFTMPSEDYHLEAKWNRFAVNYDLDGGTNDSSNPATVTTEDEIALADPSKEGYYFKGWKDKATGEAVSKIFAGTLNDIDLVAAWGEINYRALGVDPVIDMENKTLTYGLYPQTHVSNSSTLDLLNALTSAESNGWYFLDGEYYAKASASPYLSDYAFDDGTAIVKGMTYWFKCEPITWKILSSSNEEYSLVSTALLDAHRYNAEWEETDSNGYYANNYERSEIREWLNDEFYNSAFSLGNSLIQTTAVDNSAATTISSPNSYACDDTEDKVYLLSYQDYLNADYGFSTSSYSDASRQCKTTDWARANGASYSTDASYLYNGTYCTRSPGWNHSAFVDYFNPDGDSSGWYVDHTWYSVRPAITIKVS